MPFVSTPKAQKIPVKIIKKRIEVKRPKGIRIYVKGFDKGILDYVKARIVEDVEDGEDFIIKVTGPRRKGKSTAALSVARSLFPIGIDNVVYSAQEFAKMAADLPISDPANGRFSVIVFDEAGYGMFKQRWYEREQQEIVRLLEVNAAKKLIVFIVSPHNDFINSALQNPTMCKLWIDVGISQRYGKGWATLWTGIYHQFRVGGFWNPLAAFQFEKLDDLFWSLYESKKHDFIQKASIEAAKTHKQVAKIDKILQQLERQL
jgi:hypothetical protein